MKTLSVVAACALMAVAGPAFAQNSPGVTTNGGVKQNGSPNGDAAGAAKQPGKSDAGAGKHDDSTEGRAGAKDTGSAKDMGNTGATNK